MVSTMRKITAIKTALQYVPIANDNHIILKEMLEELRCEEENQIEELHKRSSSCIITTD